MERIKLGICRRELRKLKKRLTASGGHRLCAQVIALLGSVPGYRVHCKGKLPLIVSALPDTGELTTQSVLTALSAYAGTLDNADMMSMMWQIKYAALVREASGGAAGTVYSVADIDERYINEALNPLCIMYSSDMEYAVSSEETKALLRAWTTRCAQAQGMDERKLAGGYIIAARSSGTGLSQVIRDDVRRLFPLKNIFYYMLVLNALALGISGLTAVFAGLPAAFVVYTPAAAVAKTLIDNLLLTGSAAGELPMVKLSEAENYEAVCVMSVLVSGPDDIIDGLGRMKRARLKNNTPNLRFCLLCDLAPADSEIIPADEELLRLAEKAYEESDRKTELIFRRRSFSRTQEKYQGKERKRGAVEELIRYICGEEPGFLRVFGDISGYIGVPFICTLDYDTMPLMDSVNTLISAAVHPCNSGYGVFAPRMTTSLSASLRTGLTRLFGVGGCSSASIYDNSAAELYFDCFGEGTFTGKGLIRTDKYYRKCIGAFPEEYVLSHDILEGGILGTAYCAAAEFSDSMPPTTKGFFARAHRWIRGDFQNMRFAFSKDLSLLTRYKLTDNVRRAMTPLNAFLTLALTAGEPTGIPAAVALLSVTLPYLLGLIPAVLRGAGFANTREFYAPILSLSRQLLSQLFAEIIFLARNAVNGLDAMIRSIYRAVTKKRLLEWRTASALDSTGSVGYTDMLIPSGAALMLFYLGVYHGNIPLAVVSLLMCAALPAAIVCDRPVTGGTRGIRDKDRKLLRDEAAREWSFYEDHVTAHDNFLPPDNVQYSPVWRVSHRTSPTNIGMYMLSCVCALELGFIDMKRMLSLLSHTVDTAERLPKYSGNLYNWYDTESLSVIDPFVSSVDSGNFLCCLIAVRERLKEEQQTAPAGADAAAAAQLGSRIGKLVEGADLGIFYNETRKLFSVGINSDTGEKSKNCYDMLMSEARMLSFLAIAEKKAGREHWRALSRVMSRSGHYAGPVAWTGTMFEYFMPELLLESKRGSLCYEALGYAVHCQRLTAARRHRPFGTSESGYFAFDKDLNYQYKAHGVQKLALCGGMDEEYVISPYSTFLALSHSFSPCIRNIAAMDAEGMAHEKYGFYEAADLTEKRTGSSTAIVKSHMAHHVGMSICGITNALCDGRLRHLFMSDETVQRADELLEERVMPGEVVVDIERFRDKSRISGHRSDEFTEFSVLRPRINITANHTLALFLSDTGLYCGRYAGRSCAYESPDYLRRPDGMFFGFREGEVLMPFYMTQYDESPVMKRSTVFGENSTEYHISCAGLLLGMRVSVFGERAAEIREIAAKNELPAERELTFYAYMRPALAPPEDIAAHPAFADMFLRPCYDSENDLVILSRRDSRTGRETWCCAGFRERERMIYSFSRERVLTHEKPLDLSKGLALASSDGRSIPSPCVFIKTAVKLPAMSGYSGAFFVCYGQSRDEVLSLAREIRESSAVPDAVSPLPGSTLAGRIARRMLPSVLYRSRRTGPVRSCVQGGEKSPDRSALWRFGISGDAPIAVTGCSVPDDTVRGMCDAVKGLAACSLPADLVILTDRPLPQLRAENVFPVEKRMLTAQEKSFILGQAAFTADELYAGGSKSARKAAPARIFETVPCESADTGHPDGFSGGSYIVTGKGHPLCNVIASREFGCIVSRNSLGFSYAMNSRENKLTPWYNDLMHDNDGEMLLLTGAGKYYDIIGGAAAVFSVNGARWLSRVGRLYFDTSVGVYRKGMGKRITVKITNKGEFDRIISLSYYTEPVLGDSRRSCGYGEGLSFRRTENAIIVRNDSGLRFRGEAAAACSLPVSVTSDREAFFAGRTNGCTAPCAHACAAVTARIRISAHSDAQVSFYLCYSASDAEKMLDALIKNGELYTGADDVFEKRLTIDSGNDRLDRLYELWLPWQVLGCRLWARSGFYQNGGAYGFRDQLQDSAAAARFMPTEAKRQILRCCASQFFAGDVLHWWHKTPAGRMGVRTKCSDDMLWLPWAAAKYALITGDYDIFDIPVSYIDGEELGSAREKYLSVTVSAQRGSVYEHCKKSLDRCMRTGAHSLIKIGSGDWNDGYDRVGEDGMGESVWLSMFYARVCSLFSPIARRYGEGDYADELEKRAAGLCAACEDEAFENGYYLRAFYDDGRKMGASGNECCEIDLLPQAFSVLCSLPDEEKSRSALKNALDKLCDSQSRLIRLFSPPYSRDSREDPGYVRGYPEGVRENGGQYTHAAVWLALAVLKSGDRKKAEELAAMLDPSARGREYLNEPYFMTADVYTNPECRGRGGWSMYTGAAGWYYTLLGELYGEK